ncbi:MAG: 30S ribosomal protein S6 [Candidatus Dormibacteraeota bacterium]|nr:30S ribosomal protein S6 [Candidatus Dormibacteraeota bacterium]
MQRDYEILYIVRPDVEETDLGDVTKRVEELIQSLDGTIQNTNVWGKRRLAYEVDRMREGHYVLTDFQIEPARVPEMEATLKISDKVFRHLIVRKPPARVLAASGVKAGPPDAEPPDTEPNEPASEAEGAEQPAANEPNAPNAQEE